MIQVSQCSPTSEFYAWVGSDYLIGPFSSNGSAIKETISLRSTLDKITQGAKQFGENDVTHCQVDAEITAKPYGPDTFTPIDSAYQPYSGTLKYYTKTGVLATVKTGKGIYSETCYRYAERGPNYHNHIAFVQDGNEWHIYRASATQTSGASGYLQYWSHDVIRNIALTPLPDHKWSGTISCRRLEAYSGKSLRTAGFSWHAPRTFEDVMNGKTLWNYPGTASSPTVVALRVTPPTLSLGYFYSEACSEAVRISHLKSPLQEVSYGELAAEAAKAYVGSDVNMLEFLRDIRHPSELIPKLGNLSRLFRDKPVKKLSNEFLRVKYGILPTVSDVHTLWSNFKSYRPYYDKHGYQTVTAGAEASATYDTISFESTNRIKLAVDTTDERFKTSLNAFDRMGLLPNVDNIWELIPYSFVVDWFVPIGESLEMVTARQRLARFGIQYATMSHKETRTEVIGTEHPFFSGTIRVDTYHRWTTDHCPLPPLSLQFNTSGSNHWLEASALIFQRR